MRITLSKNKHLDESELEILKNLILSSEKATIHLESNSSSVIFAIGEPLKAKSIVEGVENKKLSEMVKNINEIMSYLILKTGKRYSPKAECNIKLIKARLLDGYTVQDFKTVIDNKVRDWRDDPLMDKFLRPETLFRPSKFQSYLNERDSEEMANEGFKELDSILIGGCDD